jgi:hypothetical protein
MDSTLDLILIDTPVFFELIHQYLSSAEHWSLQEALIRNPEKGAILKGSGGIRKLRWPLPGKGKSGGLRIIYHWDTADRRLFFLFCYPKSRQNDLTPKQIKILRDVLERNE